MGQIGTISFSLVAVSAQQDFFSYKPADDKPFIVHAVVLSNAGITADAGDAKEQFWGIELCRGNTTIGSGGTNPTIQLLNSSDTAFGPTTNVRVNDTTKVTGGTRSLLHADGFNTRTGWIWIPTPEMRFRCSEADGFFAAQLMTTPSEAITFSGTMYVEQI